MVSGLQTMEVVKPVKHPAELVWKAYIHELDTTLPAVMPGHFDKAEHVENATAVPGGVFILRYGPDVSHYDYVKGKFDEVDHEKFTFKATLFEGGSLGKYFKQLIYNFKIDPNPNDVNGCIMHFTIEYEDIDEHTFHGFLKDELETFCITLEKHLSSQG